MALRLSRLQWQYECFEVLLLVDQGALLPETKKVVSLDPGLTFAALLLHTEAWLDSMMKLYPLALSLE